MTIQELISLERIYNQDKNIISRDKYLESRGLSPDSRFQFCHLLPSINLRDQLLIFGKNVNGQNNIVESRSMHDGKYNKLYTSEISIPIWNIENYQGQSHIIITESAIDAESVNQSLTSEDKESIIALSTYRSSMVMSQFYFLMVLFFSKNLYTMFDNDKGGVENTKRILHLASSRFKKDMGIIEIDGEDVNRVLTTKGKIKLIESIKQQLL